MKTYRKKQQIAGLLIMFIFAGIQAGSALASSSLKIVDMRWTHEVSDMREAGPTLNTFTPNIHGQTLYLWVKMRGGAEALDILKARRKLTLIHKWEYTHFGWKTERIDVSIGRDQALDDETIQKLGYELETNGYFEWRTWSKKDHLYAHSYTVTVVDGFDEPFVCELEPVCTMTIHN